ncbi:MAG: folate/biopterin family MFS transporter [Betaproteobacteria bacterium]|nr:folate/biopterin family MFS transporter [Betaproteobacteria bacterium]
MRLSYLPPLMVYMAAGISGLTGIVGTFFVKDYLGLSAAFLAALGFWAGIPWVIKMPLGHLVDLIWRWKSYLVFLGAGLIAASLLIMVGLLTDREAMTAVMPAEAWFVLSVLLAPVGYVVQDVVADAMTVEAVPRVEADGRPIELPRRKLMHTTMQTLGRVAIIGGTVIVALINLYLFTGVQALSEEQKVEIYRNVYLMALAIPFISAAGVVAAAMVRRRDIGRMVAQGMSRAEAKLLQAVPIERPATNWWILGGSLVFVVFTLGMGLGKFPYNQEIIYAGSMAIVLFLIVKLTRELDPEARATLIGTAIVIYVFRAIPGPGEGLTWWMIDELRFDQHFLSVLSLIGSTLTLVGMFIFRRFMAERSIGYVVGFLTVCGFVLSLPIVGMYYGLHQWTSSLTGGMVDARFIAIVNTALESPLGQIAMIPMLAWIANSAPQNLKATYFAVMASFTNLALSASQLGTKYLNQFYTVTREVKDRASGVIQVPADYSQLGELLVVQLVLLLGLPFAAIFIVRTVRWRWA